MFFIKNIHKSEYREWFLQTCEEIIQNKHGLEIWDYKNIRYSSIIWLENETPILHFSFVVNKHYKMLTDSITYTTPEKRNKQHTTNLMEYVKEWARQHEYVGTCGLVHVDNEQSFHFCKKVGYQLPFYLAIMKF